MRRRGVLLMPAGALAVHQLRYLLAYGGRADQLLAEQGHAYLHSLTPWIVLAGAAAFGGLLGRAASAWRSGAHPEQAATGRIWLLATCGLVAIYAGQELLEGLLAAGHPAGVAGVLADGGWLAIPSAVLVAAALTFAFRGAERLLARLVRRRRRARPSPLPLPAYGVRPSRMRAHPPLAGGAAGRAPPGVDRPQRSIKDTERKLMQRRTIALAGLGAALGLAAPAQAHVTVHPNVIPEGAFAVLNVNVPNETDDADTTKVQLELPDGFAFASPAPPPGWKVSVKKTKLATPIKTDDGEINEQVKQITFSGGRIPPGQFLQFPMSVGIPGKSGDTLTFKALQTYSNGDVVRWIGAPDADEPAPTITISDKDGIIQDSTAEGGPPAAAEAAPATTTTKVIEKKSGNGLSVAALIIGALGLLAGGAALATRRRT